MCKKWLTEYDISSGKATSSRIDDASLSPPGFLLFLSSQYSVEAYVRSLILVRICNSPDRQRLEFKKVFFVEIELSLLEASNFLQKPGFVIPQHGFNHSWIGQIFCLLRFILKVKVLLIFFIFLKVTWCKDDGRAIQSNDRITLKQEGSCHSLCIKKPVVSYASKGLLKAITVRAFSHGFSSCSYLGTYKNQSLSLRPEVLNNRPNSFVSPWHRAMN